MSVRICTQCRQSPCFIESSGYIHPYCSRTCARIHETLSRVNPGFAAYQSVPAPIPVCLGCSVNFAYVDPVTQQVFPYCSRDCLIQGMSIPETIGYWISSGSQPEYQTILDRIRSETAKSRLNQQPVTQQQIEALQGDSVEFYKQDTNPITAFLGNFHLTSRPIVMYAMEFQCAEAAYQFSKIKDTPCFMSLPLHTQEGIKACFSAADGETAWQLINHEKSVFKSRVPATFKVHSVDIMREILSVKFQAGTDEHRLLKTTATKELKEDSPRDSFWGIGRDRQGQNQLGKLLMELRSR